MTKKNEQDPDEDINRKGNACDCESSAADLWDRYFFCDCDKFLMHHMAWHKCLNVSIQTIFF